MVKSNIQVKFLTREEMGRAKDMDFRYEHVNEDNLGFADVKKNRIFVRAGLAPELTRYLINHELSHLYEEEGTHEDEHGIRHKGDSGGFWKVVLPVVLGAVGMALGGPLGSTLGASIGGGLGGTALASGIGGAVGHVAGLGAGMYAGNVGGSTLATGKPDWANNAINTGVSMAGMGVSNVAGSSLGNLTKYGLNAMFAPRVSGYGGDFGEPSMIGRVPGNPPIPKPAFGWGQESFMGSDKGTGERGGMDLPTGKGLLQGGIEQGAQNTLNMGRGAQTTPTSMSGLFNRQSTNPLNSIGFNTGLLRIGR